MGRWLIQLVGEHRDLEEFPYWFPEGEIYAFEEDDKVFLTGSRLERCSEAIEVQETALQIVDEYSAVISLLWPAHKRPEIVAIIRETDDGKRNQFIFTPFIESRAKLHHLAVRGVGQAEETLTQTRGQQLINAASSNHHLRTGLHLWGDQIRTWPRLYRILEELETYLGQKMDHIGFCSKQERSRFTHSANCAETAGKDARHAGGKFDPPEKPMALGEATEFIRALLEQTLSNAASTDRID
ncbi:hypothetical protein [Tautonia rosea]|uniref:hypothetical protein n=1 Tax=Tautonia rosea TaxID=2728037 RepID=UPI0014745613|nr:hypothetical protein [Tautonia rosea]